MILTDYEIAQLLNLPKTISNPKARRKIQKKSMRLNYTVLAEGASFEIYVRQSQLVPDVFSCGLIYFHPSGEKITLMRCNGGYHDHGNPLEGVTTIGICCHIHIATQRYMEAGRKPEHYAEPTTLYSDIHGALATLMDKCNVTGLESDAINYAQNNLFDDSDY